MRPSQTVSWKAIRLGLWAATHLLVMLLLAACRPIATPPPAMVNVTFAIVNGTTGFAATIYLQEVDSGQTITALYPAFSDPITMTVPTPGMYVFYARLVEAPDDYHFGATACAPDVPECDDHSLIAVDLKAGRTYSVAILDRAAQLPPRDEPVAVPWHH